MLIKFKSDAYADITMFGDIATRLLKIMGHSGTVPGAILAHDVPAALDRLQRGVKESSAENTNTGVSNDRQGEQGEGPEEHVSLSHRALPLIELLTAAKSRHRDVMWEEM
ncbi:MAG: hypothetical protein NTAFB09_04360 [Nitrosospira sp.]